MDFLRSSCEAEFSLVLLHSQLIMVEVSCVAKKRTSGFLNASKIVIKLWVHLVQGSHYWENISSLIDFSWLGISSICQIFNDRARASDLCLCCECKINIETRVEENTVLPSLLFAV